MNFKSKIQNFRKLFNGKAALFMTVFATGIFLRVYKFSDWLYFKRDEARDAFEIWQGFSHGPGWLPLLGPDMTVRQGARFFVGPIYYYFQYFAAVLFRNIHPAVLAFPDLFFSILTIPLFFLLLRKFFSRNWSFVLAGLFAIDFLAVQYSRFAWNPNSLPFFNVFFFYALLNVFDTREKRPVLWAMVAGAAFAVATQLHVLAMIALPAIAAAFLLLRLKETGKYLDWKKIGAFLFAFAFLYIPVIAHEIAKHGRNFKVLFRSAGSGQYYSSLADNILTVVLDIGKNWFLILTGYISGEQEIWTAVATWVFLILPVFFLMFKMFRTEKDEGRKNFIALVVLWFAGYLVVYVPVAMHMQVRFILPIIVLPFIFAGMIFSYLWSKNRVSLKILVSGLLIVVILGNLFGIFLWFREIRIAQDTTQFVNPKRTLILKKQDGVVLWHLERAAEYMKNNCDEKKIYLSTEREYLTPMMYELKLLGVDSYPLSSFGAMDGSGCVYDFEPARTGKALRTSLNRDFNILEQRNFGILRVSKLEFKKSVDLSHYDTPFVERKRTLLWKDLFTE